MRLTTLIPSILVIFAGPGWATPNPSPVLEAISAPIADDLPSDVKFIDLDKRSSPGTSLNPRAPTIGLEAHLFFQSIGCGLPYDLDTGDIEVGPCLQARRGGLTWLIRSGELIWTLTTPQPNNCKIRFFQNQGCSGTSVLADLFICRNNQPNGFWSFRVTC